MGQNTDFQVIDSQKFNIKFPKLNLDTIRPEIIEEKSGLQTSKSPNPTKVTKKSPVIIGKKKLRKAKNTQKNLKKAKKKKAIKNDSKRETKNTFKSTVMTESEEKSIYQTTEYSSPLSALVNGSPDNLPKSYSIPEFDLKNLSEKQAEPNKKRKLKSGASKTEFENVEKFPLLRQKHIREFTSSQSFGHSKSKNFSGGPSRTLISRFPSEPDSKLGVTINEKVGSVDRFIKNFSNSMLASLHVMIVNLSSSLEALSSEKKLWELKKLNNFFGIYPDLNSNAKKEKISKRLKIELNVCINMAKDQSFQGKGKALKFLTDNIKKSIISEGIKKAMLEFLKEYKGDFDKKELEEGLKQILYKKLQRYELKAEMDKPSEVKNTRTQSQPEKTIEIPGKRIEVVDKTSEAINKSRENTDITREKIQETFHPAEMQKIHLNDSNVWNTYFDKNLEKGNIYKELNSLDFGKSMGIFVFSSKIDESYLPTNKTITKLTKDQQDIEVSQDLNNLASYIKKYNFFKLKEKDFELSDEKLKLIIQNIHEIDPSQKKNFEKLRVQKYLSRIDFYKNKKKFVVSPKPANSFSNISLSAFSPNNIKK